MKVTQIPSDRTVHESTLDPGVYVGQVRGFRNVLFAITATKHIVFLEQLNNEGGCGLEPLLVNAGTSDVANAVRVAIEEIKYSLK